MNESIVALICPFDENNKINYDELDRLCDYQIENKTDGILLLGTTQESESLTKEEKHELVDFVYHKVYKKMKIIIGIISNITEEVVSISKQYDEYDIDSFLVITPYYNKTNVSGLIKHFTYIADHVSKPIVLYNVPKRTGMSIPIDVVRILSYHHNIIGIKDASGDALYTQEIAKFTNNKFKLYCGDDKSMIISLFLGASGSISVIANAFPLEVKLIHENFDKNINISKTTFNKLNSLIDAIFKETSPIGIKYLLYIIGFNTKKYRRPLDEPSLEVKRLIEEKTLEIIE